jgi:hypothetical protein
VNLAIVIDEAGLRYVLTCLGSSRQAHHVIVAQNVLVTP